MRAVNWPHLKIGVYPEVCGMFWALVKNFAWHLALRVAGAS